MDKRTQQDYISWRAEELARSGVFPSWVEIVRQLRVEGAYCAHEELTAPFTRWRLNRLCKDAVRMTDEITRVVHRHGDQKKTDPDLVLEIGKPLPRFYQVGRQANLTVRAIHEGDPVCCTLSDGDEILIGRRRVLELTRREKA